VARPPEFIAPSHPVACLGTANQLARMLAMADTPMLSTKKCPHCQQWSTWQQRSDDRCEHCGELLDPQAYQSDLAREKVAQQKMPSVVLVQIKPEDGPVVRFFKTIVRGGQLAFAAILAFIVWVVTVLVG